MTAAHSRSMRRPIAAPVARSMFVRIGQGVWSAEPVDPLLPGQFRTDFSEYDAGQQPSDWTKRFTGAFSWIVEDDTEALGGKVLRCPQESTATREGLTWDLLDTQSDREVVQTLSKVRFMGDLPNAEILHLHRASGVAGSENAYRIGTRPSFSRDEISKYVDGSYTFLGSLDAGRSYTIGQWYWVLAESVGNTHRVKVWADGTERPESWRFTETDSSIAGPGWIGLFRNRVAPVDIDFFSVGLGGVEAPLPSVPPSAAEFDTAGVSIDQDFDSGDYNAD